jgi:hypothetical protein
MRGRSRTCTASCISCTSAATSWWSSWLSREPTLPRCILPAGMLRPTGKQMDAPCCDVFELVDGKIKRFDCYPEGSVILTQLGVIGNLSSAFE